MLKESKVGDFIIRPSSRGQKYITLTWKFDTNTTVHLSIQETKEAGRSIYNLNKHMYESLDEIIERYINPCNLIYNKIKRHSKFVQNVTIEQFIDLIKKMKIKNKHIISYRFGCF